MDPHLEIMVNNSDSCRDLTYMVRSAPLMSYLISNSHLLGLSTRGGCIVRGGRVGRWGGEVTATLVVHVFQSLWADW